MRLFSKKAPLEPYLIIFGANFSSSISNAYQAKAQSIKIDFPHELMKEIDEAIDSHSASANVLYEDEMQFIDVVGEAQNQEDLIEILRRDEHELDDMESDRQGSDWYAGFLMPEPYNQFDANAVKVLLIDFDPEMGTYPIVQVGYLPKEQAKKVSKKVMLLLDEGKVIPLLMKITGGTPEKPNVGVIVRAKTKAIKF